MRLEPGRAQELRLAGERLCLDFANTLDPRHGAERPTSPATGSRDVGGSCRRVGCGPRAAPGGRRNAARTRPRPCSNARVGGVPELRRDRRGRAAPRDDLQVLESACAEAMAHARLGSADGGYAWRWPDECLSSGALWPVIRSAVDLLTTGDLERIRQCPGAGECGWLLRHEPEPQSPLVPHGELRQPRQGPSPLPAHAPCSRTGAADIDCRAVPVNEAAIGKQFPPFQYEVGKEKIAEYAHAVGRTTLSTSSATGPRRPASATSRRRRCSPSSTRPDRWRPPSSTRTSASTSMMYHGGQEFV